MVSTLFRLLLSASETLHLLFFLCSLGFSLAGARAQIFEKQKTVIHNGVIAVFQRKGLPDHELYNLNEGVRQLLKTELGSFFTEYLQVGMCFLSFKSEFFLYLGFMCTFR
uniref:Uncharacterized protein n=1 Tax=Pavo cristatus TaxID=9049 RepID=A0A8C9F274_PAVCR